MIVEDKGKQCHDISTEEGKTCPMTVADKYNNDKHKSRRTTGNTCFTYFPDDFFFRAAPLRRDASSSTGLEFLTYRGSSSNAKGVLWSWRTSACHDQSL